MAVVGGDRGIEECCILRSGDLFDRKSQTGGLTEDRLSYNI